MAGRVGELAMLVQQPSKCLRNSLVGQEAEQARLGDKGDKMLNLALAAPMNKAPVRRPTSRRKTLARLLDYSRKECYYDLTNMAWKGIWLLKMKELPDCPRKDEIDGYACHGQLHVEISESGRLISNVAHPRI